jgi:hypothetical protein
MTWGGTKKKIIEIVTLETGDMPQKVLFGPIVDPLKAGNWTTVSKKKIQIVILRCAMGSRIIVVK